MTEDSFLYRWQKLDEDTKQKWREQTQERRSDAITLTELLKQQNAA